MMRVLENLYPEAVFRYFEELCAIPHGSRDTKRISDECVRFAQKHGLTYVQDKHNNVILYKKASAGYETHPTVILQGHLDMVCEKEPDCTIDFKGDGLRLKRDGGYICAEGTTLGADDGIAVAYALALLESNEIKHPPLEVVLTADEEIGLLGAAAMDMSALQGRVMLNIDSDKEGFFTVSCAGGTTSEITLPITREATDGRIWKIRLDGLAGGHSGLDINKDRGNANKLLGRLLARLPEFRLISINGGSKDNAIPRACEVVVCSHAEGLEAACGVFAKEIGCSVTCRPIQTQIIPMTQSDTQSTISLLQIVPNGVQAMSADIDQLVQTSLNLGILEASDDAMRMTFSVRSSVDAEKIGLTQTLREIAAQHGAAYSQSGDYPAWEYRKESRLRDVMGAVYTRLFGKPPVIEAIHAGLECGIFSNGLPGLDAVSFGPWMHDIHTTRERLDIASTARMWEYLLAVLEKL